MRMAVVACGFDCGALLRQDSRGRLSPCGRWCCRRGRSVVLLDAKIVLVKPSIRLLAIDIDGTLLNPEFQISPVDMAALRRVRAQGIEVVVVTGRRHTFALPIVQQLGFDLWVISSNGAVTRSLAGETFHRDLLPAATCLDLCTKMQEFRGNTVLTFDIEAKGAIVWNTCEI